MDYYAVVGMVAVAIIALFGFLLSFKASIKNAMSEERKPIEQLNISVTRLNGNFEHMLERDDIRDKRIDKHGEEIDSIIEKQRANEKSLAKLELRVDTLEKQAWK